jgi:hypothetical protein
MCSKKLKAALPQWLPFYDEVLSEEIKKQLLKISAATIDRLLKPQKVKYKRQTHSQLNPFALKKAIEEKLRNHF